MKEIRINCTATQHVNFHNIKIIQGDLKDLTGENYQKLKKQILKHGFVSPIHVWHDGESYCSLDGTQRLRTLAALENEGFYIPDIPITEIRADNLAAAKDILLSLVSQYGTINTQGFMEFAQDLPYPTLKELEEVVTIPGLDFEALTNEYLEDHKDKEDRKPKACPHCGEMIE